MNILLVGNGRISQKIQEYVKNNNNYQIIGILDKKHPYLNIEDCLHAIIDFSSPNAIDLTLSLALQKKVPLIIGTTGYSDNDLEKIKKAAEKIPIGMDANFSYGFHLFKKFHEGMKNKKNITKYLLETHHKNKKDIPSGSSLLLKDDNLITFSLRGGNIPGVHELRYLFDDEEIIFTHRVYDRMTFVKGAFFLLNKIKDLSPCLYHMDDFIR